MIADQYETEEDTVWAPVMGEARAVKQSYAWRLRLPVGIVLGMAAAVFLVVGLSRMATDRGAATSLAWKGDVQKLKRIALILVVARMLEYWAQCMYTCDPATVSKHDLQRGNWSCDPIGTRYTPYYRMEYYHGYENKTLMIPRQCFR